MSRKEIRAELLKLLGDLPERQMPVKSRLISVDEKGDFLVEKLVLDLNGLEPVPAYFVTPKTLEGQRPVVIFNHSHGGNYTVGKEELLNGVSYLKGSYAQEFVKCGYSVLCLDEWAFGERRGRTETEIFKEMLWKGQIMWGMMVYDSIRAVDYLFSRPDVDTGRIATIGMSMGGVKAWWLSAMDERIKVCVDICSMTEFQSLIDSQGIDKHGVYYFVPGLLKNFTTAKINSLICPRPHLSINGVFDRITPANGLDIIDKALSKAYKDENCAEHFELRKYSVGHFETSEMRNDAIEFLRKWL